MSKLITQDAQKHNEDMEVSARTMSPTINQGAVAIEQERAIAEAQGQLTLAKRFPRNLTEAHIELMSACKSRAFAEVAFYSVPNRGSGPSIRLAEEIARVYGNFQYGHRELSRDEGKSEVEVFAWDMEKNNRSIRQITVNHIVDTRNGPKVLTDQTDIDNKIANIASKQVRGRILALMPKWLVQDAVAECRKTLAGNNDEPMDARIRKMVQAFGRIGVSRKTIEDYLGKPVDELTGDEIVDLQGMHTAIREGAKASEVFSINDDDADDKKRSSAGKKRGGAAEALKGITPAKRKEAEPQDEPHDPSTGEIIEPSDDDIQDGDDI